MVHIMWTIKYYRLSGTKSMKWSFENLSKVCHSTERNYICPTCSKAFKTQHTLHEHQRRHLDIQNDSRHVECEYCQKKFRTSQALKYHIRIHTGEKPYKCDQCDYASTLKGNLRTVPYDMDHIISVPNPNLLGYPDKGPLE